MSEPILLDLPTPDQCLDMPSLRRVIDQLDKNLVYLLAQRQTYVERAAVLKADPNRIRDHDRIEQVVQQVVQHAEKAGLDPTLAAQMWRDMIEHFIRIEHQAYEDHLQRAETK